MYFFLECFGGDSIRGVDGEGGGYDWEFGLSFDDYRGDYIKYVSFVVMKSLVEVRIMFWGDSGEVVFSGDKLKSENMIGCYVVEV